MTAGHQTPPAVCYGKDGGQNKNTESRQESNACYFPYFYLKY